MNKGVIQTMSHSSTWVSIRNLYNIGSFPGVEKNLRFTKYGKKADLIIKSTYFKKFQVLKQTKSPCLHKIINIIVLYDMGYNTPFKERYQQVKRDI